MFKRSKSTTSSLPPPYYKEQVQPSAPPIENNQNNQNNKSIRNKIYNKVIVIFRNTKKKNKDKKPKYHGPVNNNENEYIKVTVKKLNERNKRQTKESFVINKNYYMNSITNPHFQERYYPNDNVKINGIEPLPYHLRPNRFYSREHYFREQKRLLHNRQMEERCRLEAQRVYPGICYNC